MEPEPSSATKNRDFACSCGKKYFSYAALFTHIKQKHDGKAPGPIVRPRSQRKRGRPRKTPLPGSQNRNSDSDFGNNSNGFSIPNEHNNSFQQSQKKTKKAAEMLLGSGSFQAFQTYKGQNIFIEQSNNLPLKRATSYSQKMIQRQSIPKKSESQLSLPEKTVSKFTYRGPSMTSNGNKPKDFQFIQNHKKALVQLLTNNILMTQQQLLNSLSDCSVNLQSGYCKNMKSILYTVRGYLAHIHGFLVNSQYLLIKYILSLFVQFVLINKLEGSEKKLESIDSAEFFKSIDPFLHAIQSESLAQSQSASENLPDPTIDSKRKYPKDITTDLVMDVIMLFAYWVNLDSKVLIFDQESENQNLSIKKEAKVHKKRREKNKRDPNDLNAQLMNLMRIENHRHEQPRIINTIEDILAQNNSDSQYNSSDQFQQGIIESQINKVEDHSRKSKSQQYSR